MVFAQLLVTETVLLLYYLEKLLLNVSRFWIRYFRLNVQITYYFCFSLEKRYAWCIWKNYNVQSKNRG